MPNDNWENEGKKVYCTEDIVNSLDDTIEQLREIKFALIDITKALDNIWKTSN